MVTPSKATTPSKAGGGAKPSGKTRSKISKAAKANAKTAVPTSEEDVSAGAQTDKDIARDERRREKRKRSVSFAAYDSDGVALHGDSECEGEKKDDVQSFAEWQAAENATSDELGDSKYDEYDEGYEPHVYDGYDEYSEDCGIRRKP